MSDDAPDPTIPVGTCPICGKPAAAAHRPFCSRRCSLIDLGRWLGGNYRVPAGEENEEDEDRPPDDEDAPED